MQTHFVVLAGSPDVAVLRGSGVGLREGLYTPPTLSCMVLCGSIAPDPVDFGGFLPSLDQSDLQGSRSHPCRPSLVQLCQVVHVCRLFDDIIHLKERERHDKYALRNMHNSSSKVLYVDDESSPAQ